MKNRNINIALLALFQFLIFVAPITIKAEHRHGYNQVYSSYSYSGMVVSKKVQCLVCSFEFVTFINHPISAYLVLHETIAVDFTVTIRKVFKSLIIYFSLRAPPQR